LIAWIIARTGTSTGTGTDNSISGSSHYQRQICGTDSQSYLYFRQETSIKPVDISDAQSSPQARENEFLCCRMRFSKGKLLFVSVILLIFRLRRCVSPVRLRHLAPKYRLAAKKNTF